MTKKWKDTASHETESYKEFTGGEGSGENSTAEYIKRLQAELAELKAVQGIRSSSHIDRHRQREHGGSTKEVPPR